VAFGFGTFTEGGAVCTIARGDGMRGGITLAAALWTLGCASGGRQHEPTVAATPQTARVQAPGYGPWALGMRRQEVIAVSAHAPYEPVEVTGGLETRRGVFEGQQRTVSFVFDPDDKLVKIQVWVYEGSDHAAAAKAWGAVYAHLRRRYGRVEMPEVQASRELNEDAVIETFTGVLGAFAEATAGMPEDSAARARFQMAPESQPPAEAVWASLMADSQRGFFVFVFHAVE